MPSFASAWDGVLSVAFPLSSMMHRVLIASCTLFVLILGARMGVFAIPVSPPERMSDRKEQKNFLPPVHLWIPVIEVDARIEAVGQREGRMDTPSAPEYVAWYMPGPRPGEPGRAVIAGHLDSKSGPAVFWNLRNLAVGDSMFVKDTIGNTLEFQVREMMRYIDNANAPVEEIFSRSGPAQIVLITCTGAWNQEEERYQERLAVYADFISASSASVTNSEKMINRSS